MDIAGNQVGDTGMDLDRTVEERDFAPGGFGLGQGRERIGFIEEHLALQVALFDEIAIDQGESADAGTGEQTGGRSPSGSATGYGDVGRCQPSLAFFADSGEEHLTGIPFCGLAGGIRHTGVLWIRV